MRTIFKTSYDADIRLFKHSGEAFWYGLLVLIMILMPYILGEYFLGEVINVLIWGLAGLGLMVLTGQTGHASLGHSAFLAVGCYSNVILQGYGVPFFLSFPISGLLAGLAGVLFALPTLRLHGIYLAIATLALAVLLDDLIVLAEPITGGVIGLSAPAIDLFGYEIDRYANTSAFYYLTLAVVILIIVAYRNMLRSPLGRSFAAIRDSEISAQAMGVNLMVTKAKAFGLSCAITGLAGALMGHFVGAFNNETFNIVISIQLLLMIVVGGLGSIHGAFLGAMVIGIIPVAISFARDFIGSLTGSSALTIPGLETGILGLILIFFILFEPLGLYARWLKIRTYFNLFPFSRRDMFRRQKTYLKTERLR
jgi:branched-chain amino acid transport system permease protein